MIDIQNSLPRSGTYAKRPYSAIQKIACHWDAVWRPHEYDSVARYIEEANYHIGQGGDGLFYHFKIDNVGEIFQCRDITDVLWNVGGDDNWYTLAVCIDCGGEQLPTREQMEALNVLLNELCTNHPEFPADQDDVLPHSLFSATACPGDRIRQALEDYRNTGNIPCSDLPYDYPADAPVAPEPTPITPLYRVFDDNDKQLGAFASYDNARNLIISIGYTGYIKHPDGHIEQLQKPPVQPEPAPAPETPVPPVVETPDVTEKINKIYELLLIIVDWFKKLFRVQ